MTRLLTTGSEQYDSSQAIVSHQRALVPVEERLQKLRVDREVHSYKQIWTKDPHGGAYRKVGFSKALFMLGGVKERLSPPLRHRFQGRSTMTPHDMLTGHGPAGRPQGL